MINTIRDIIRNNKRFALSAHVNPDGDAIGSSLALASALKKIGKNVTVFMEPYSAKYDVIPGKELICEADGGEYDVFIALDCGSADRLFRTVQAPVTVNIDHHVSNTFYGMHNLVVSDASSTSEIVFELLDGFVELDADIASGIYAGLLNDTGGFRHGCTSPRTHRIAAELVACGINFTFIYNELFFRKSFVETQIFAKAIEHIRFIENGRCAYSYLSLDDLRCVSATPQDLEGIVEYILNIRGVEVSLFVYERDVNETKASLRSKEIDVSKIAVSFGGGGHIYAAGCTLNCGALEAAEPVLAKLSEALNGAGKI